MVRLLVISPVRNEAAHVDMLVCAVAARMAAFGDALVLAPARVTDGLDQAPAWQSRDGARAR
jgi:hypothetical protein